MRLPAEVRDAVLRRVYADADRLGWGNLPATHRSRQYDLWAADPAVGGVLTGFLEPGRVRTWLKDNPLKHYETAKHGIGPYAAYANVTGPTPTGVAERALGHGWDVDLDTVADKPLRFRARRSEMTVSVAYGPTRKFRDLLWAALNDAVDPVGPDRMLVVVVDDHVAPTSQAERHRQRRLTDRCGVELRWVSFTRPDVSAHP